MKLHNERWVCLLLAIALVLGFASRGLAQESKSSSAKSAKSAQKPAPPKNSPDLFEWKSLLDHLALEARTVDPEQQPALLMAEVADTYWRFDTKRAKALFTDAFERALSIPYPQRNIQPVLSLAAKRDRALAVSFIKRMVETREEESSDSGEAFRVAQELLYTDQASAVELAQTAASPGPTMSGLEFVFQLAEKDRAAADQMYGLYLQQLTASGNPRSARCFGWLVILSVMAKRTAAPMIPRIFPASEQCESISCARIPTWREHTCNSRL